MADTSDYTPPKVWAWNKENGGHFASINRPIAGATHEKDLRLAVIRCSFTRSARPTA
jgi:hypothetical protein